MLLGGEISAWRPNNPDVLPQSMKYWSKFGLDDPHGRWAPSENDNMSRDLSDGRKGFALCWNVKTNLHEWLIFSPGTLQTQDKFQGVIFYYKQADKIEK